MPERPTLAALAKQLDRMEETLADQRGSLHRIEEKADITNGRVTVIEHTLHGPIDRERRHLGGGLLHQVEEIEDAVTKVGEAVTQVAAVATSQTSGQAGAQRSWQTIIAGASVLIAGLSLSAVVLGLILA